jgi:hypothetical protein
VAPNKQRVNGVTRERVLKRAAIKERLTWVS